VVKEVPFEREFPVRIDAKPRFGTVESFGQYVNRYKTDATLLFAKRKANEIYADFEYHLPGEPSWNAHRATLPVQFSEEFSAWHRVLGQSLTQLQLAELLDARIDDIREPAAAVVLTAVQNFGLRRTATLKQALDLNSNRVQLVYEENDAGKGGGSIDVPTQFVLRVPIYEGAKVADDVTVRLRYAVREKELSFTLSIPKLQPLLKTAFEAELASAEEATGLQAMLVL
jgi:uncharacterized protein YfdQ (DUF2303 family)